MLLTFKQAAAALLSCLAVSSSFGAAISYTVTSLGGASWRYDYTVVNNTLGSPLSEFTVFFSPLLYANLSPVGSVAGWDPLTIQPDSGIPADGYYDAAATGSGLPVGATLAGFSVSFDFLGIGSPAAQSFDVVDPTTFAALESGQTVSGLAPPPRPGQAPSPASLPLLGLGLAAFGLVGLRRKHTASN